MKERLTFDAEATDFMATFQLHLMGAFAQMERAISMDRQREGIDLARARGAYLGRAKRLTDVAIEQARHSIGQGVSTTAWRTTQRITAVVGIVPAVGQERSPLLK